MGKWLHHSEPQFLSGIREWKRNQGYMVFGIQTGKGHFFPHTQGTPIWRIRGRNLAGGWGLRSCCWRRCIGSSWDHFPTSPSLWQPRRVWIGSYLFLSRFRVQRKVSCTHKARPAPMGMCPAGGWGPGMQSSTSSTPPAWDLLRRFLRLAPWYFFLAPFLLIYVIALIIIWILFFCFVCVFVFI